MGRVRRPRRTPLLPGRRRLLIDARQLDHRARRVEARDEKGVSKFSGSARKARSSAVCVGLRLRARSRVICVTAQPVFDAPDPSDPARILRDLPAEYHAAFLAEYAEAVEKARRPEGFAALAALLRLWRLRAAAYADPGFHERLVAVRSDDTLTTCPSSS